MPCDRCESLESRSAVMTVNGEAITVHLCNDCRVLYKLMPVVENPMNHDVVTNSMYFKGFPKTMTPNMCVQIVQWVYDNHLRIAMDKYELFDHTQEVDPDFDENYKQLEKDIKVASKNLKSVFPHVKQHTDVFRRCIDIIKDYLESSN